MRSIYNLQSFQVYLEYTKIRIEALGFPWWSSKTPRFHAGDAGSISGQWTKIPHATGHGPLPPPTKVYCLLKKRIEASWFFFSLLQESLLEHLCHARLRLEQSHWQERGLGPHITCITVHTYSLDTYWMCSVCLAEHTIVNKADMESDPWWREAGKRTLEITPWERRSSGNSGPGSSSTPRHTGWTLSPSTWQPIPENPRLTSPPQPPISTISAVCTILATPFSECFLKSWTSDLPLIKCSAQEL